MKLVQITLVACIVAVVALVPVRADGLVLTEAQIATIRNSCGMSQQALERLHAADKPLRVNLGQRYTDIGRRLMSPFISRAELAGIDTVDLNATSVQYRKEIDVFSASYMTYEASLRAAQAVDCSQRPVDFYGAIETARQNRQVLHQQTRRLNDMIDQFRTQVDAVKTRLPGGTS